jgi:hypothetical protein
MGNAQQPTRRTRHLDLKKFTLLDWIQKDLIFMKRITTNDNSSDELTQQTGRQLFYRHFDYILGKIIPNYVKCIEKPDNSTVNTMTASSINDKFRRDNWYPLSNDKSIQILCSMEHGGISYIGDKGYLMVP